MQYTHFQLVIERNAIKLPDWFRIFVRTTFSANCVGVRVRNRILRTASWNVGCGLTFICISSACWLLVEVPSPALDCSSSSLAVNKRCKTEIIATSRIADKISIFTNWLGWLAFCNHVCRHIVLLHWINPIRIQCASILGQVLSTMLTTQCLRSLDQTKCSSFWSK